MKKTLLALSLISMFGLAACNDGFMLKDDRTKTESSDSFSLDSAYTGPGKDYKPVVDPTKKTSLYKVFTDRDNNNCKIVEFIEDQLSGEECENKKLLLLAEEGSEIDAEQAEQDGIKSRWYPKNGPHKGIARYVYSCLSEENFKSWQEKATLCK